MSLIIQNKATVSKKPETIVSILGDNGDVSVSGDVLDLDMERYSIEYIVYVRHAISNRRFKIVTPLVTQSQTVVVDLMRSQMNVHEIFEVVITYCL